MVLIDTVYVKLCVYARVPVCCTVSVGSTDRCVLRIAGLFGIKITLRHNEWDVQLYKFSVTMAGLSIYVSTNVALEHEHPHLPLRFWRVLMPWEGQMRKPKPHVTDPRSWVANADSPIVRPKTWSDEDDEMLCRWCRTSLCAIAPSA